MVTWEVFARLRGDDAASVVFECNMTPSHRSDFLGRRLAMEGDEAGNWRAAFRRELARVGHNQAEGTSATENIGRLFRTSIQPFGTTCRILTDGWTMNRESLEEMVRCWYYGVNWTLKLRASSANPASCTPESVHGRRPRLLVEVLLRR